MMRKKNELIFTVGLCVILIVSLAANIKLYQTAKTYYTSLCETQLDLDGKQWAIQLPPASHYPNGIDLIITGDSRAQGWDPNIKGSYLNSGISRQTTSQILSRYQEHVLAYSPKVVLIQAGINDLKGIPLMPEKKDAIIQNCKSQLIKMASLAKKNGSKVIITTIIPPGNIPIERRLVWSPLINQSIGEVNHYLMNIKIEGVFIVDISTPLTAKTNLLSIEYQKDFLHLNQIGYHKISRIIRPFLSQCGVN